MKHRDFLLFDGATGTYMMQKYDLGAARCESRNIENPAQVEAVHREYIAAGAGAIKANTFAANTIALNADMETVKSVVVAGCEIAKRAVHGTDVRVFASIGPVASQEYEEEYRQIIDCFLECGITEFLLETFMYTEPLLFCANYIKSQQPDAYVICECSVAADRYTAGGISAQYIVDTLQSADAVDACGFNCTSGPMHLERIVRDLEFGEKPLSIMPNAGYPTVIDGRAVFDSSPDYFAGHLAKIRRLGVSILGGCCGTTPAHIAEARKRLDADMGEVRVHAGTENGKQQRVHKRQRRKGFIAVELDSPLDAELEPFIVDAQKIAKAGADLITIADCPIGRARADSSMMAGLLQQRFGIEAMPHLTCRDRNLNASKALLLGLNMQDIKSVLVVTGDPIPMQFREQIMSVYQFNSVKYAAFIEDLNRNIFGKRPFEIMGALNINAENFKAELKKAKRKEAAGMTCFLTQPLFDARGLENLKQAKAELQADILAGIMPIVSYKNACFANNEIAGIRIPQEMIEEYKGKDREQAARLAVQNAVDAARQVKGIADGYYLILTLKRVDIICKIIEEIQSWSS